MTSARETGLAERITESLPIHPAVDAITLAGSRARGDAGPLSDWDFEVQTSDFPSVAGALPGLVAPLEPLAQQWDRLSVDECHLLMLRGAAIVDDIFEKQRALEPRWVVSAEA